jgi:hypothetical protein
VTTPTPPDRVVVLTKDGCHLCEDALVVVETVCAQLDVGWRTRDLAQLPAAERSRWAELVPVVLIDDEVHEVFRVDPDRLRRALAPRSAGHRRTDSA